MFASFSKDVVDVSRPLEVRSQMDAKELGSVNCLKRLTVDSEGIYLGGEGGVLGRKP